jgi:equilibrative nucleoside transporter 1/2/3
MLKSLDQEKNLKKAPLIEESGSDLIPEENSQKLMFFLLGNASLFSFNLVINAADVYQNFTANPNIATNLSRAYNIPSSVTSLILCFLKPKCFNVTLKFNLIFATLILFALPLILLFDSQDVIYYLTIVCVGLLGVCSSFLFSSSNSLASQFGPKSGASVSSGCGICGIFAAVMRFATKGIFSENHLILGTFVYFIFAALIVLGTFIYIQYKFSDPSISLKLNQSENSLKFFSQDSLDTIKVIWLYWTSTFLDFCITLTLFPGYLAQVKTLSSLGSYTPLIITSVFQIFDFVGRSLPIYFMWPSEKFGYLPVLSRFIFFPIFILSLQQIISVDEPFWTFIWNIPFAFTNGYFGTISLIYGANHSQLSPEKKEYAGYLLSFSVNGGILLAMGLTFCLPTPRT